MGDPQGAPDERPLAAIRIEKSFWMSKFEVTNEQFARFDPAHESRFEHRSSWWFDEEYTGWPLNRPQQPVVRVSWEESMEFCRWLSDKIGEKVILPTEAQWEWACRAGTDTPLSYGGIDTDFSPSGNLGDASLRRLADEGWRPKSPDLVPKDDRFNDGALVTCAVGRYAPNAWGSVRYARQRRRVDSLELPPLSLPRRRRTRSGRNRRQEDDPRWLLARPTQPLPQCEPLGLRALAEGLQRRIPHHHRMRHLHNEIHPMKKHAVTAIGLLLTCASMTCAAAVPVVSVVVGDSPAMPLRHGIGKLRLALQQRGVTVEDAGSLQTASGDTVVVAGLISGSGDSAQLIAELRLTPNTEPESLLIRKFNRQGKTVVLSAGSDARGVMYALLDVADRVGWAADPADPFSEVRDTQEKPFAPERALSIYTFNRAYWESRFYDEAYWARYLDMLAQNRFNSLVVIFGYENGGFLAPCYPYFFDVQGFPDVRMVGITPEQQQRNLAALNRLIQMAHDRGLNFTVGIWDHIYRGGVQGGGIPGADDATKQPVSGLVWGVTGDEPHRLHQGGAGASSCGRCRPWMPSSSACTTNPA